ncbi:MAG: hypothetical protein ACXWLJ_10705 [Rhizomicrobium sp.]
MGTLAGCAIKASRTQRAVLNLVALRDKYLFSAAAVAGLWCDPAFSLKSFLAEKKKPRDG